MLALIIWGAIIIALFWYIAIRPLSYWKTKGVKQIKPVWLFGDNFRLVTRKENFSEMVVRFCKSVPGARYVGMYQFTSPALVVCDPDLVKQVTVKDFDHFVDRRNIIPEGADPYWEKNLFILKGQSWKEMRPILSPSFTTSKMKSMFVLMSDCVEVFVKHFTKMNQDVVEVEMKDILTRFANDVIASTAFGIQVDSLNQPKNEFFLMGKEATDFTGFWNMMKMFALVFMPNVCKLLSFRLFSQKVSKFFQDVVDETIRVREEKGIVRQDMIQLLMEARQGNNQREEDGLVDTGFATVEEADIGKVDIGSQLKGISNIDITAQALVFFFAGFESVTTLTSFMAYELAINPDIQDKLRQEILKTKEKCGNTLDYDALMKMKYMDMVVSESLRKWPSNIVAERVCTKSYTIEPIQSDEVPVHLEKGSLVVIPIFGFHYDPKYYPNPEKFDPERFSEENKNNIKPYTYMPFGVGPRNCIGSRFALLEAKILFFHLLANFEIVPTKKTSIPIKLNQKSFSFAAEDGLNLGLKRLIKN